VKESTKKIGKKAGGIWAPDYDDFLFATVDLDRFAEIARKDEREKCAKLFDAEVWSYDYREIAAAIRARTE
jgi:hypothetical protein